MEFLECGQCGWDYCNGVHKCPVCTHQFCDKCSPEIFEMCEECNMKVCIFCLNDKNRCGCGSQ